MKTQNWWEVLIKQLHFVPYKLAEGDAGMTEIIKSGELICNIVAPHIIAEAIRRRNVELLNAVEELEHSTDWNAGQRDVFLSIKSLIKAE